MLGSIRFSLIFLFFKINDDYIYFYKLDGIGNDFSNNKIYQMFMYIFSRINFTPDSFWNNF